MYILQPKNNYFHLIRAHRSDRDLPEEVGNRITGIVNYLHDVHFFVPIPPSFALPHLSPTALILLICFYPILRETNPISRGDPQKDRGRAMFLPGPQQRSCPGPVEFSRNLWHVLMAERLFSCSAFWKLYSTVLMEGLLLKWPFWNLRLKLQVYQSLRLVSCILLLREVPVVTLVGNFDPDKSIVWSPEMKNGLIFR